MWYGLKAGLDYQTAMNLPIGRIIDLMHITQIKTEGAEYKPEIYDDLEIIPDVP